MKISKVIIQPLTVTSGGRLLAFASLIVEQRYAINGLRIVRSSSGELDVLYPAMHAPNRHSSRTGRLYAFVPMNADAHQQIRDAVINSYAAEQNNLILKKASNLKKTGSAHENY